MTCVQSEHFFKNAMRENENERRTENKLRKYECLIFAYNNY